MGPEVQIVGSSAINNEKIDVIELCEKYGKHVMLDKPLVTSRKGLSRLEAVFGRKKIQVGMMLVSRDRSSIYTLKQQIDEGQLGEIVSITMRKPHRLSPETRQSWHFEGKPYSVSHQDLLLASTAAIEADEQVVILG